MQHPGTGKQHLVTYNLAHKFSTLEFLCSVSGISLFALEGVIL